MHGGTTRSPLCLWIVGAVEYNDVHVSHDIFVQAQSARGTNKTRNS